MSRFLSCVLIILSFFIYSDEAPWIEILQPVSGLEKVIANTDNPLNITAIIHHDNTVLSSDITWKVSIQKKAKKNGLKVWKTIYNVSDTGDNILADWHGIDKNGAPVETDKKYQIKIKANLPAGNIKTTQKYKVDTTVQNNPDNPSDDNPPPSDNPDSEPVPDEDPGPDEEIPPEEDSFETVDDFLDTVRENYLALQDFKAKATLKMEVDGKDFAEKEYLKIKQIPPDKERADKYTSETYDTLEETTITESGNLHIIYNDGSTNTIDLKQEASMAENALDEMDVYFNQEVFKEAHNITIQADSQDTEEKTVILEVTPKTANNLYTKILIGIDYGKGIIESWELYKDTTLVLKMNVIESEYIDDMIWLPTKTQKITPIDDSSELTATMTYTEVQVNVGIDPAQFEVGE